MRRKGYVTIGFLCLFYWMLDSIWSYVSFEHNLKKLIFSEPGSYLDTFLLKVPPYQFVSRFMVVFLFIVIGVIIIEFMTRQQSVERERKEAHDTLLKILDNVDATIYVSDMQSCEILFMNQFMIDRFGGDFKGKICHEVFQNSKNACEHCKKKELLDESGNPGGMAIWEGVNPVTGTWYLNHDRAIKWVDGRVVHLQIATDITRLKEIQEEKDRSESRLRQAQKMEAIGNLAGGIAHDFNNILTSIIGNSEMALLKVGTDSAAEGNLKEVCKAGLRAKDLVNQILAFARQSEEGVKPLQVRGVIREVLNFIRSSIPASIEIRQSITSDSFILCNATHIHQIMMNLCTNASHAMEDGGGVLEVTLKDVRIEGHSEKTQTGLEPGDYVHLSVSDTGVGIGPEIMGTIFEPYFTTKGPGEGTGMGLAVTHGIVESCGGKITVDSWPGKGTVFTIILPVTEKREGYHPPETTELPTGTERILFVDDESSIAEMAGEALTSLGYSATTRTSSMDAMELFRSMPSEFDLVVTDMNMPNMTGDQLAEAMLAIRTDIPIILCTGYSKKISDQTAADIGIKAVFYKPFVKADLAKIVRNTLDETAGAICP